MSMPSWVHRPKDQPPNSEPLEWKKKKKGEKFIENMTTHGPPEKSLGMWQR